MINNEFKNKVKISEQSKRITEMKDKYENGIIDENMTDEDTEEIINLYNKEEKYYIEKTARIRNEKEKLKNEIARMIKELKN